MSKQNKMSGVAIRCIPYPYKSMLAICSDLDETPDKEHYLETVKYLNTTQSTIMGKGVGLEVGNTIYFDMPKDQFSYWNTDDAGREAIRRLIKLGYIDCFHSFGDDASSREDAVRALSDLKASDCVMNVWIDHAIAPTNIGDGIMQGQGDMPTASAYHADLTLEHGVRFVWRGRVTSIIGQGRKVSFRGIFDRHHVVASTKTIVKELIKFLLAKMGQEKYSMHGKNELIREVMLRDGNQAWEFIRCNPHWGGVSVAETADGLAEVLNDRFLNRLVERETFSILYTHLGKTAGTVAPFNEETKRALQRLAQYSNDKQLLVATTRRLLDYSLAQKNIVTKATLVEKVLLIEVSSTSSLEELQGMTWYVPSDVGVKLLVNGETVEEIQYNQPDHTGRASVSIPWCFLIFPASE